jgi:KH-domain-like of EngA bacterial GTPase enzymes, C-terminal
LIIVHGNSLDNVPSTYTRFLEGRFRAVFKLEGTPMRVEYRTSSNPFDEEDKTAPTKAKASSPVKSKYIKAVKAEVALTAGDMPKHRAKRSVLEETAELAPKERLKMRATVAKLAPKKSATIKKYKETGRPVVKRGQKSTKK